MKQTWLLGLCLYCAFKIAHYALEQCHRILPIVLNLCSICKALAMFYEFNILFLLSYFNYKIMSISSVSSSSTVQHTINNSSIYLYENFEFIFVAFATLFNTHFDKIIATDSPKSHNPVKSVHFIQILSIVLAIFAYYAGIMLNAFAFLLCAVTIFSEMVSHYNIQFTTDEETWPLDQPKATHYQC